MTERVFGATLLVSGCCIGAGMLGLPVVSSLTGFIPSSLLFFMVWGFMLTTGLLLLEVNLWSLEEVSFMTMAEKTLGSFGKYLSAFLFLFLFYGLMVAYISGGGDLVQDFFEDVFGWAISKWMASLIVAIGLGSVVAVSTSAVDNINRFFMVGLIVTYLLLVGVAVPHIDIDQLSYHDWSYSYLAVSVMIISFGFHNLIPTLVTYLKHDRKKIQFSLVLGSALPLFIYLLWDGIIMGLVSVENSKLALDQGDLATRVLRAATHKPWINGVAAFFAFFALVTSFLGVALSLVDFLFDGLRMDHTRKNRIVLTLAVLVPPLAIAFVYPHLFLWALGIAGGFSAVILFGILPSLMVWRGRYVQQQPQIAIVRGGKTVLILIIIVASVIVVSQVMQELNNFGI